ncbi:hypothetical protein N1851_006720 [Merluccius polli]|uniref:Uncharacterized protein n=1 Tax=Merluccius polli TaxID=89951 RepID=A0AA47N5D3_MERPO|nr:hypothetical protein N1851_006720 [Merluccius polli]
MEHLMEGMDHEEMFKILATVFKKEVEISRKIYTVHNTQQLINQTCDAGFQIDRLLKFDADFSEFIDVDPNVCISDLDKFQIYLCESTNSQADNAMACHVQQPNPEQTTGLEPLIQKKLPEIFEEIRINGIVSEKTRLKLVKLVVSDLVERHGFYPSSDEKVALAGTIITTFPCLKVQVDGKGQGFNPVQEVQDANDTRELINLMKRLRPSAENLASIKSGMQRTFTHRRSWISSLSPTMGEVFQEYPRFLDIPALFDSEFNTLCEGKGDLFMRRWEAVIIPQLTAVAVKEKHIASLTEGMDGLIDDERSYRMLQILTHLLPPIASSRCSVKSAITHLIDFVPTHLLPVRLLLNPVADPCLPDYPPVADPCLPDYPPVADPCLPDYPPVADPCLPDYRLLLNPVADPCLPDYPPVANAACRTTRLLPTLPAGLPACCQRCLPDYPPVANAACRTTRLLPTLPAGLPACCRPRANDDYYR